MAYRQINSKFHCWDYADTKEELRRDNPICPLYSAPQPDYKAQRDICAESDARMLKQFNFDLSAAWGVGIISYGESLMATRLYWNRGTK